MKEYDYVELQVDLSPALRKGARGTVLLVYSGADDDYEVEFTDHEGRTLGIETVNRTLLHRV